MMQSFQDYGAPELFNGKYDSKYGIFNAVVVVYKNFIYCPPLDQDQWAVG